MADEEIEFEESGQQAQENSEKKYITATLEKQSDSELISSYDLLRNVGGFNNRDVVEAGVNALFESDEFKKRASKLKDMLK